MTVHSNRVVEARPRWLQQGPVDPILSLYRKIEQFESFADVVTQRSPDGSRRFQKVALVRTYALGDILMLLPIARRLRIEFDLDPIKIVCRENYWKGLRKWAGDVVFDRWDYSNCDYGCDVHIDLDSCLEADHHGGTESNYHRCELYGHAMGMTVVRA